MSHAKKRMGFTLVELLVVIAIIAMLMALLLPAVNAAREQGRATTCRNNLRQLSLALISYDTTHNALPELTNWKFNSQNTLVVRPLLFEIWPQLERNDLFEIYNRDATPDVPNLFLALMVCPSDPQQIDAVTAYCYNYGYAGFGYRSGANAGSARNKANGVFGRSRRPLLPPGVTPSTIAFIPQDPSSSLNFVNAKDGQSNTLLITENIDARFWNEPPPGSAANTNTIDDVPFRLGFTWYDAPFTAWPHININRNKGLSGGPGYNDSAAVPNPNPSPNPENDRWDYARPSANHTQTAQFAFGDGHVRPLRESIDYSVLAQLMTSDGLRSMNDVGERMMDPNSSTNFKMPVLDDAAFN